MKREAVQSQALNSVGYDPDACVLEVEFESGAVYRYFDVPAHLYASLMTAASHGEYFARHVRNAGFEFLQLQTSPGGSPRRRLTRP